MRTFWLFCCIVAFVAVPAYSQTVLFAPPIGESIVEYNDLGGGLRTMITDQAFYMEISEGTDYLWQVMWRVPLGHRIVEVHRKSGHIYVVLEIGSVYDGTLHFSRDLSAFPTYFDFKRIGGLNDSTESQIIKKMIGDDLYILSFEGVYVSRDNGVNWTIDTVGMNKATVNDITTADQENVYAATTKGILYQAAKGNTWEGVNRTGSVSSIFYDSVDKQLYAGMTDGSILWGAGDQIWNPVPALLPNTRILKWGVDVYGDLFAALSNGALYRRMDASFNDITQNLVTAIGHTAYQINSIGGDSTLYVATSVGLYRSTDRGDTWSAWNNGIHAERIFSMQKLPSGEFFASGAAGIFRANPIGTAWSNVHPRRMPLLRYGSTLYAYQSGTPSVLWTFTVGLGGSMSSTVDSVPSFVDLGYMSVDEFGTLHAISNTYSSTFRAMIYERKPGGTWTADTNGYTPNTQGNGYAVVSDGKGYLYAATNFKGGPNVLRRPITGGTWTPFATGLGTPPYLTNFVATSSSMLSNFGPTIYATTSTGWTQIPKPAGISGVPSAMSVDSSGTLFAAFSKDGHGQGIYYTTNSGTGWTNAGFDSLTINALMSDGSTTYASTNNGIYALTAKAATVGADVTPPSIDFGNVALLEDSLVKVLTISNTGTEMLTITSITSSDPDFTVVGTADMVPAWDTLRVPIQFRPTTSGKHTATLSVRVDNDPASPHSVSVEGFAFFKEGVDPNEVLVRNCQNYPNPFSTSTQFHFALPEREYVTLIVRDVLGHEVAQLASGVMEGEQSVLWDASGLANGVYVVELNAGGTHSSIRITK